MRQRATLTLAGADPRVDAGVSRWILWSGVAIVAFFVVLAIFAPLLAPYGFDQVSDAAGRFPKQGSPDGTHPLGTTVGSYDVLSRVIWGARTAIEVVLLAVVFSLVVGVPLGLFSGYTGGRADRVLVLIMDALFAFPYILLAIVIAFLLSDKLGQGVVTAAVAITAVYVPQYFRVVRNHVISVREESYVDAARALGAPRRTIISRYILQNVVQSVPALATLNAADAILTLAALGFLGYGIQPTDAAEWGYDLQRAIDDAGAGIWWTGLFPGLAIVALVTGFTLLGEGLNDVINPLIRARSTAKPDMPERPGAGSARRRRCRRRTGRRAATMRGGHDLERQRQRRADPRRPRSPRLVRDRRRARARRRRRQLLDRGGGDPRARRRVRLRQVDARPRRARPAPRRRRGGRLGPVRAAASSSGCRRRRCATCAAPSSA